MDKQLYKLLIRSFDEPLKKADQNRLDQALAQSEELRKERNQLLAMRKTLSGQEFRFQPFFSGKVITRIQAMAERDREALPGLTFAFKWVALPALAFLIILLVSTYFVEQSLSIDTMTGVSEAGLDDIATQLFVAY